MAKTQISRMASKAIDLEARVKTLKAMEETTMTAELTMVRLREWQEPQTLQEETTKDLPETVRVMAEETVVKVTAVEMREITQEEKERLEQRDSRGDAVVN